jgi:hypothetical protein
MTVAEIGKFPQFVFFSVCNEFKRPLGGGEDNLSVSG